MKNKTKAKLIEELKSNREQNHQMMLSREREISNAHRQNKLHERYLAVIEKLLERGPDDVPF